VTRIFFPPLYRTAVRPEEKGCHPSRHGRVIQARGRPSSGNRLISDQERAVWLAGLVEFVEGSYKPSWGNHVKMAGLEGGREAGQALVDRVREEHSLAGGTARENVYVGLSLVGGTTTVNHVISGTSAVFSSLPPHRFCSVSTPKLEDSCRQTPPMLKPHIFQSRGSKPVLSAGDKIISVEGVQGKRDL
jgi:hypothetical protein